MYWSGLITLFICTAHSAVFEIEEYNLTIAFNAQTSSCTSCYDPERLFSPTFTDIPTPAGEKNYVTNFDNPLPPGYLLKGISMVYLVGGFKTSLQVGDDTVLSVYFGLQVIHSQGVFYDDFLPTSCHNCHIIKNFTSEFNPTGWWPNYRYNTEIYKNEFTVYVLQNGVALSKAIVTLQAVNFNPQLTNIFPSYIPVGGIAKIQIFANNILNSNFNYKCQFRGPVNVTVEAEIEPGAVYCSFQVPNLDVIAPFDELYIFFFPDVSGSSSDMIWANGSIGPKVISLYEQPSIYSVSPTEGDVTGKEVVTIYGSGFFESPHLYCMFGDPDVATAIRAVFVDFYSITCETPSTGYNDGQVVVVRVSENGQSWTYNRSVTFMFKVTPWTPLQPVVPPKPIDLIVIIVCSSLFGVFAIAAIGYFIYTRRAQKLLYTDIPDIDSSAIIKVSELDIRERIGRGSFGDVHRAYWRYTEVAVKKIFNPSDALLNELYDEARLMITLRHPNIVTFMACTAAQPELCIVTEYVARGSLYKILHSRNISILSLVLLL